ncbi:cyclic GMP-AMP synthase-like receptor 1 isoform X2 [Acropora muricata]|uniref:cyclic GMP-AMP synthase-like receptor 1 isoform X2 n=1 Tax=Acropora muricata TaxID=159855 RepID=UPI0034E52DCE
MSQLNIILNRFTNEKVTLRKTEKTRALEFWEPKVEEILRRVKRKDERFARMETQRKGSYYERCKVGKPDEFDLTLVLENLELDDEPYDDTEDDGMGEPPKGFTRVMIDRGEERIWRRNNCVNARGMLNAAHVKSLFADLVRGAVQELRYGGFVEVSSNGPAVTLLLTNNRNGRKYSIDLTPVIKDKTWPEDADEWKSRSRGGWPNQNLVREICSDGCHLVPKPPKGSSVPAHGKEFLWRYSFSSGEKKLLLKGAHGEPSSCRKQVLKILKVLNEELQLHPLKSYHLKTMLFFESEANPHHSHWSFNRLGERFLGLLKRLENCLRQRNCPHYFMREFNVFEVFPQQRCAELCGKIQDILRNPEAELNRLL